ncbi:MAG: hypothetical protein JXJ04_20735, partial [Spirochaetales bacterium]|nr:hypothetical protein [Spirochaetales bacterium]
MRILSREEMNLLEAVQSDFPLTRRPFQDIGKRAGLTEQAAITCLEKLKKEHYIREISILLNARKIGYKSTLVALKADESAMERIVPRINAHPGVSHNYLRDGSFNIWFTLTIPAETDYNPEVTSLLNDDSLSFLILPSLRIFKIGVKFGVAENTSPPVSALSAHSDDTVISLSEFEKELIRKLQVDFPLDPEPWSILAHSCNIAMDRLLEYISTWKKRGVIKRIAAFLRHRNLGYKANGMACYTIPAEDIQKAGF